MVDAKKDLASLYESKLASLKESLEEERRTYRGILESAGFAVRGEERPAGEEVAYNLIAEKGGVVLRVSQLSRGGKTFAITVSEGTRAKTMRLYTDKLEEAIACADTAQYLAK